MSLKPPKYVDSVRKLIYWQYANLIARAAGFEGNYGFVISRYKKLLSGEMQWSSSVRDYQRELEKGRGKLMRWGLLVIVYARAFFSTLQHARYVPAEHRQKIAEWIMRLAELRGWETLTSDRLEFSTVTVEEAPTIGGVYRIYDDDELVYVGAVCRKGGLRDRLRDHLKNQESNRDLADFIVSGRASVEWYACQAPGWMEDYELTRYREEHGRLPRFNRIQAGMVLRWWW